MEEFKTALEPMLKEAYLKGFSDCLKLLSDSVSESLEEFKKHFESENIQEVL